MRNAEKSIGFTAGVQHPLHSNRISPTETDGNDSTPARSSHAVQTAGVRFQITQPAEDKLSDGGLHVYQQVPGNKVGLQM